MTNVKDETVTLLATGDNIPSRDDYDSLYQHVAPLLKAADISFGQVETVLIDKAIDDLAKIESSGSEAKPAVVQAPAVPAEPEYTTHEVQEGEDMTAICIRFSVSSAAVEALNNLEPGAQLRPGQVIKIPSEATR